MYNVKAVLSYFEDVLKNLPVNAGDTGDVDSVPGSRRSPGASDGNPLQYSCLGNPMVRGAWRAAVHRITKSQSERTHTHTHTHQKAVPFSILFLLFTFLQPQILLNMLQKIRK